MSRRRLTTAVTLTALCLLVLGMAVWGFKSLTQPLPSLNQASSKQTCSATEVDTKKFLARKDVTVSVYNAGGHEGLAGETLDKLESNHFKAGEIGNAPSGVTVARAEVRATKKDDPAARLVADNLGPGTQVVVSDEAYGPGVDVFVGNKLHRLNPKPQTRIRLADPLKTCVPVK